MTVPGRTMPVRAGRTMPVRAALIFAVLLGASTAIALEACAPATSPTPTSASSPEPATQVGSSPGPSIAPAPSPTEPTGFAFDAESVVGYYVQLGFTCAAPQPSTLAAGFTLTSCRFVDGAGRTHVIGVVTDPADELADGYASVQGAASEAILEPSVAMDRLSGFLGAMLGESRGEATLQWLAAHIGDDYAETTSGDLRIATYLKDGDHSTIYLELANEAYLEAPRASPAA